MSIRVTETEELVIRAQQLFQMLTIREKTIKQTPTDQQLSVIADGGDAHNELSSLQQAVNSAMARIEFDAADGSELSDKLSGSLEILGRISANQDFLVEFGEFATTAMQAMQFRDPETIRLLQGRVQPLMDKHPNINPQNFQSLLALSDTLSDQALLAPLPQQLSTTQIIVEQDAEFNLSLLQDQLKEQLRELEDSEIVLTNDHLTDFNNVLNFYIELKKLSFKNSSYTFPEVNQKIETLLHETAETLRIILSKQASKEVDARIAFETRGILNPAFTVLKNLLADRTPEKSQSIERTLLKLSPEEKKSLFVAFNTVLKEAGKITDSLPEALHTLDFSTWGSIKGATWEHRRQAVEKILAGAPQQAAPRASVQEHSMELKRRLDEAIDMKPPAVIIQPSLQRPVAIVPVQVDAEEISEQFQKAIGVDTLLSLLPRLVENATPEQLGEANDALFFLDANATQCIFRMSAKTASNVAIRPDFHMYFIHKNETPGLLVDDMEYGHKAFSGVFTGTNTERTRAVQRTLVEVALQNLEETLGDDVCRGSMLDLLEKTQLDPKDRANSQTCAAYNIFGAFYNLHVEAHRTDPSLVDPNDARFQGDFGRHGFSMDMPGIKHETKMAAIAQVRDALKAAWKV